MSTRLATWNKWRVYVFAICAGSCLGLLFRFILGNSSVNNHVPFGPALAPIVSIGFLTIVPMGMGYLSVAEYLRATPVDQWRTYKWAFLPWLSIVLSMLVTVLFKWEGRICLIFAAPIMLLFGLLGGLTAWIVRGKLGNRSPGKMSALALPLLFLLIEAHIPNPYEIRTVRTEILIHAPAKAVWSNIKSVRLIQPTELPQSWVGQAGFPRPLAATLSREEVGGVRQASFSGGLVFTETVNLWNPEKDLRFSIRANTDSIPRSTLDEHVTIGGAFFDVLDGEYTLEPRADGIMLHLSSRERLSTHVNPYAGMWTDAVMTAIQRQILVVIRERAESESGVSQSPGG